MYKENYVSTNGEKCELQQIIFWIDAGKKWVENNLLVKSL